MKEFISIHIFVDGSLGVEKVIASDKIEAYEMMVRNDSTLLVISKAEI